LNAQPHFLSLSSSKRRRGPGRGGAFYQFPLSPALSPLVPRREREPKCRRRLRAEHDWLLTCWPLAGCGACVLFHAPPTGSRRYSRLAACATSRFMESLLGFFAVHWDPEPDCVARFVWCPAFRRSEPAKAGTPNRRFMESPYGFCAVDWDHEPVGRVTPCAPQFGNAQTARRGLTRPTFRFMESPLSAFFRMHWDHEPTPSPSQEGNRTALVSSPPGRGQGWVGLP